ncbi:hypothetical protein OG884_19185 [Streptosporangium sp. NBC_01755]|uniref:hypothetical protein n=1 Tax=unclassified Streptosporangium TaxID=2632669 RepID=UPI002DDB90F7|nr:MULTISPECIES: hypothetical protein [unclassified Streptosporangium]WSA24883.1 hypothetical protein OIE13_28705 [Streptosporangium sp. NBC_01810]WSD03933.1 hypothetical protein OG884_19185 [Streptosporangium sp. NBC_01755]
MESSVSAFTLTPACLAATSCEVPALHRRAGRLDRLAEHPVEDQLVEQVRCAVLIGTPECGK